MKVRFLVSMGGVGQNYDALEKDNKGDFVYYEFSDSEAISLINNGIAEPKNKKDYESAIEKIESEKTEQLEQDRQIALILQKDELIEEKNKLQERINEINLVLEIKEKVVLEEEEQLPKQEEPEGK